MFHVAHSTTDTISLSLNLFDGSSLELQTSSSITVGHLKDIILSSRKSSTDAAENLVVIFAGKALQDHQTLHDCLVRDATVLHVVRRSPRLAVEVRSEVPQETVEHETPHSLISADQASALQCTFYGFCKEVCQDVTAALLRFACGKCGGSVFVVDPMNELDVWEDILDRGQVHGVCYNNCVGDYANLIFKCAAHRSLGPRDRTVYLRQVKLNDTNTPCTTCGDVRSPVLNFSCDASHVMCLDCFHDYGVSLLNERRFIWLLNTGYTVRCPVGCQDGVICDPHHFYLLGERLYETYKEFGAEECFLQQGGTYCAEQTCGAPFIDDSSIYFITCQNGHRFCRNCGERAHSGPCDTVIRPRLEASFGIALENARSRRTIARTTKPCPGCKTPIERNGGCMHVICSRCGKEFCWICGTDWGIECMSRHWFA